VHTEVENSIEDHRLRVHFPAPLPAPLAVSAADYDGHYQVIRRPVDLPEIDETWVEQPRPENPQRSFTDISDGKHGLMIAVRGLPEISAASSKKTSELALTLLRCTGWLSRGDLSTRQGDAGPSLETPDGQMPGKWLFDYAIIPHSAGWQNASAQAWSFAVPLRSQITTLHDGDQPANQCLVAVDQPSFQVTALKAAEDRSGWILRGVNLDEKSIQIGITVNLPFLRVMETHLDETPIRDIQARSGQPFGLTMRGHQILTLKFFLDAPY
jgi:alpha-mannosidase